MIIIYCGSHRKRDIAEQLGKNLVSNSCKHATCLARCIKSRQWRVLHHSGACTKQIKSTRIKVAACAICVAADQFNYGGVLLPDCTCSRSLSMRKHNIPTLHVNTQEEDLSIGLFQSQIRISHPCNSTMTDVVRVVPSLTSKCANLPLRSSAAPKLRATESKTNGERVSHTAERIKALFG
jgi:hypothetical protein